MIEFNIKSVVEFLHENGYRVKSARVEHMPSKIEVEVSRSINATLSLREVVNLIEAIGFTVTAVKEVWKEYDSLQSRLVSIRVLFSE